MIFHREIPTEAPCDAAADGKAETESVWLGGIEWLEQVSPDLVRNARPVITHTNHNPTILGAGGDMNASVARINAVGHCIESIEQ